MDKEKTTDIAMEVLNDAFWLSYILELKRKITDVNTKEVLVNFLLFFGSIFCEELLSANLGGMTNDAITTEKEIATFRNSNLKHCYTMKSNKAKTIVKEMGVDLNSYVFDIVLTLDYSNIVDINFRNWNYAKEENQHLIECIVSTPNAWVDKLVPEIYEAVLELMKGQTEKIINKLSKVQITKKSYSSHKLYINSSLNSNEKIYLLQRYGIFQLFRFIEDLFNENLKITVKDSIIFDYKVFLTKCKAVLIEMVYNDWKNNKSITVLGEVYKQNQGVIPTEFYSLNRKIRNNIHYSDYHYLTDDEFKLIQKYQNIYLKNIIDIFDSNFTYKFGFSYHIGLAIAKLTHTSSF